MNTTETRSPLAVLRDRVNLSQSKLAKALGVSKVTVANWENGRSKPRLTVEQFQTLSKKLRVPLSKIPKNFAAPKS